MLLCFPNNPPPGMENGIEVEYNNEKGFFLINIINIKISINDKIIEITLTDLNSVFVKDSSNRGVDNFPFYIKMKSSKNESFVISFKNEIIRDVVKIFLLNIVKIKDAEINKTEKSDIPSYGSYLMTISENHELIKIDNTKSSLVEYLISNPVLLNILNEMNCTLAQFYNHLKQSYFYSIQNNKNVFDRLLNEKLRDYTPQKDSFATRLNNFSFLSMNERKEISKEEKVFVEKELDFVPIYAKKEKRVMKKKNNFVFPKKIKLSVDFEPTDQEDNIKVDFDKKSLKKLADLCKLAYKCTAKDEDLKNKIINEANEFKDILKDERARSLNPLNFFRKD
ncbi:hypothetical protein GVAV_001443 [Gurleya vavrai]